MRSDLHAAVLALPPKERAALAAELLESLDEHTDEDAEVAWEAEIERRVEQLERGEVKTIPASDVMRRLGRS